ncbi:MAG: hypothetical protein ACON47_04205 [Flavobacteriaceae bacterium]
MTRIYILCISLFSTSVLWSQAGTGSPYSFGGLGEINYRGNHWSRAMGGIEFYTDSIHVDFNNPASLGTLKMTNYALGVDHKTTQLKEAVNRQTITTAALNYLGVSIPTKLFGFNFGVLPYSSVGYRVEFRNETDESTEIQRYEGNGGLNMAFASVGLNVFPWWSVGATARYSFGNITHRSSQLVNTIDRTTFLESNSSLSGVHFKYATNFRFSIGENNLHFYSAYAPEATIYAQNDQIFTTLSTSTSSVGEQMIIDLASAGLDETLLILPETVTYGFGLGKQKKWFLGAQYEIQTTSDFRNDFITLDGLSYEDGNKVSIGGFFIPNYGSLTSYWKRIVYRVGYFNQATGIRIQGSRLTDRGIAFGVGLPALRLGSFSNANLGLTLGTRSTDNSSQLKENYWQLKLGFSLNDLWFVKRKYN